MVEDVGRTGSKCATPSVEPSHRPKPIYEPSHRYAPEVGAWGQSSRRPSQPWLDGDGRVVWSRSRIAVSRVIDHKLFELFMSLVISFNVVVIVMETDREALCFPTYLDNMQDCPHAGSKDAPWIIVTNNVLLSLYTVEVFLRLFVERRRYGFNMWNLLDAFIVVAGWLSAFAGTFVNVAFLRFFRLARLTRMLRLFIAFRELYMLLAGLLSALRTIMWGAFMILGVLLLFSIMMVEFIHPVNASIDHGDCERCGRGYATVLASTLTLFQTLVAGDSWGQMCILIIEEAPWTAGLFVASVILVSLGLMNLILSVIVERAAEARERDMHEELEQKEREIEEQKNTLFQICSGMDKDGGGTLCLSEVLEAFDENPDFKSTLLLLDIHRDELPMMFKVLDMDGSGDVSYSEFCDQLHQIRTRDTRTMLTFMKLQLNELKDEVSKLTECSLSTVMKEVKDGSTTLQHHGKLLQSIDDRLYKLTNDGVSIRQDCMNMCSTPSWKAGSIVRAPSAPPQPLMAAEHATPESLLADIQNLGSQTQELAGLKGVIVRRVEEQVSTLTRQAGTLAAIGVSVKSGTRLPQKGSTGLGDSNLNRVCEKLGRLRDNMHSDLSMLLREVDQKLEDGAATLARNTELLASLSSDLGCQVPSQDTKQRDSRQAERKANQGWSAAYGQGKDRSATASTEPAGWTVCSNLDRKTSAPLRALG